MSEAFWIGFRRGSVGAWYAGSGFFISLFVAAVMARLLWPSIYLGGCAAIMIWTAEQAMRVVILDACHDPECTRCGIEYCPEHDPLHFHHDGCPSCCTNKERA